MADNIEQLGLELDISQLEKGVRKADTSIDRLNKGLNSLDSGLVKAGKRIDHSKQALTKFSSTAKLAGQAVVTMAAASGAALAGLSVQIVKTGSAFEASMAKVRAISGATTEEFAELEAQARKMGETTKFSASESASALEFLSMAGFTASQSIEALPGVLDLAAASGIDLGQAADITSNALTAMRLQVDDLGRVNDVFAATTTSTNTNMIEMAEAFKYSASVAASTGVSIEELSGLIGLLGNAGIKGSQAGTSIAFAMSTLLNPTAKVKKVLGELNVEIGQDLVDTFTQLESAGATSAQIMEIFGERAGRSILALQGAGGAQGLANLTQQLQNSAGKAEELAKIMNDTTEGAFKRLGSVIESIQLDVFEESFGDLKDIVNLLSDGLSENKDQFVLMAQSIRQATEFAVGMDDASGNLTDTLTFMNDVVKVGATVILGLRTGFNLVYDSVSTVSQAIGRFASAYDLLRMGEFKQAAISVAEGWMEIPQGVGDAIDSITEFGDELDELWSRQLPNTKKGQQELEKQTKSTKDAIKTLTQEIKTFDQAQKESTQATQTLEDVIEQVPEKIDSYSEAQKTAAEITNQATQAFENAERSMEGLGRRAEQTAQQVERLQSLTSSVAQSGRFVDSGLVGQTFSVTTGGGSSSGSGISPTSTTATVSSLNNRIRELARKQGQFVDLATNVQDYLNQSESLDFRIAATQDKIYRNIEDLSNLTESDLEQRLGLSQELFENYKNLDRLQENLARESQQSVRSQLGLVDSIVDQINQISTDDLVPVDKLDTIQDRFNAIAGELDSIDFSQITQTDQGLIQAFQQTAQAYLQAAQDVYKSGDPYQVVKSTVLSEFENLAANLANSVSSTDFSVNVDTSPISRLNAAITGLGNSAEGGARPKIQGLSGAFSTLGTQASTLNTIAGITPKKFEELTLALINSRSEAGANTTDIQALVSQLANLGVNTSAASADTEALAQGLKGTENPFTATAANMRIFALNLEQIAQDIGSAIGSGGTGDGSGGGLLDPITSDDVASGVTRRFVRYRDISTGTTGRIEAVYSDGNNNTYSAANARVVINDSANAAFLGYLNSSGTKLDRAYFYRDGGEGQRNHSYDNANVGVIPSSGSFYKGTLDTGPGGNLDGRGGFAAILHPHEAVIRREHVPAVRSFMDATGLSRSYSGGRSGSYESGTLNAMAGISGSNNELKNIVELLLTQNNLLVQMMRQNNKPVQAMVEASQIVSQSDRYKELTA